MYRILNTQPIELSNISISTEDILTAINSTNQKLRSIADHTKELSLNIFEVLDLRTLSGAVGETFVGEMTRTVPTLRKNPSIDGYPDLVQCATPEMITYFETYASQDSKESFRYGGIEVKNTFGYKKNRHRFIRRRTENRAYQQKAGMESTSPKNKSPFRFIFRLHRWLSDYCCSFLF